MDETFPYLRQYELQNNLIIGNCIRAKETNADTSSFLLATVKDEQVIKMIVMMTPPFSLLLFEVGNITNHDAMDYLIEFLVKSQIDIPGIVATKELSSRFVEHYTKKTKKEAHVKMNMRIYRLDEVKLNGSINGRLRHATEDDLYYIPYWNEAFAAECNINLPGSDFISRVERNRNQIDRKDLYVYEDGIPVSVIGAGRKTLNGIILNNVYTPPHYRGKGYATAMVASLCTLLLKEDYQFCGLFTDLKNPTSNNIYQKVGFYPICDFDEILFTNQLV